MGLLHPKRALYNMIYRRTTFSIFDVMKATEGTRGKNSGCCVTLAFFITLTFASIS